MKFLFALFASLFLALPAWAVDVKMGSNMNLVFDPSEITIDAGDTITFVNDSLPPHNVIVEDHPEISHDGLAFSPGETIEVTFPESGDFNFWCEPHKGAGMTGVVHVN
jgi:plastocyanin|tara:strand:+ start:427 stop:750 length:324 start_codon:yes stop_codon:yes gene_type:complete